jgi:hypothetical protein
MALQGVTEKDGSFRRLVRTVKSRQRPPVRRGGRPSKNRVAANCLVAACIHQRMKNLAELRTRRSGRLVSAADVYNDAARLFVTDMEQLLGYDLRLPSGTVTLASVLGLRDLIDRPILTPLRELNMRSPEQHRTTLYFDPPVWDALIEVSLRFGLQMRRTLHVQPVIELAAAWYVSGFDVDCD